jgi:hypothetical protein
MDGRMGALFRTHTGPDELNLEDLARSAYDQPMPAKGRVVINALAGLARTWCHDTPSRRDLSFRSPTFTVRFGSLLE